MTIKQADTVLLGYPLNWNMSSDIQEKDLRAYELIHDPRGPAMTNSFMAIGWKFVNDDSMMRAYYTKSYQDFMVQPFKVSINTSNPPTPPTPTPPQPFFPL